MSKTFFVRHGFANNSSSSHSVIFTNSKLNDSDCDSGFGWNYFTASSIEAKSAYLASTVRQNIHGLKIYEYGSKYKEFFDGIDFDYIHKIVCNRILKKVGLLYTGNDLDGGIDHQSVIDLPVNHITDQLDINFIIALKDAFLKKEIVILGGHDNIDEDLQGHKFRNKGTVPDWYKALSQDGDREKYPVRSIFDAKTNTWILLDTYKGTETRFSFDDGAEDFDYAGFPTLVDIKITDYCDKGCKFCYQNSSTDGKHSKIGYNNQLINTLKKFGVMQVVLGGGEPTKYPSLDYLISEISSKGMAVSLTTRNYRWHKEDYFEHHYKHLKSVAISVNSPEDVVAAVELKDALQAKGIKVAAQTILGVTEDLTAFLDACKENHFYDITLLGYKDFGRGTDNKVIVNSEWIEIIKKYNKEHYMQFGVESVLASLFKEELVESGVPVKYLDSKEGKQSFYVDAVSNRLHLSSFDNRSVPLPETVDGFKAAWETLHN